MGNDLSNQLDSLDEHIDESQNLTNMLQSVSSSIVEAMENSSLPQTLGLENNDFQEIRGTLNHLVQSASSGFRAALSVSDIFTRITEIMNREDLSIEDKEQASRELILRETTTLNDLFPGSENIETMQKFYLYFTRDCLTLLRSKPLENQIITTNEFEAIETITIYYAKINLLNYKYENL